MAIAFENSLVCVVYIVLRFSLLFSRPFLALPWLAVSGCPSDLLLFRLFLFSVCCFRMGPFLFPSLYARANIIMCLSFSSRVLRYKNMLCNTSVIQSITKKFQEIRIIFPSYVCW